MSTETEASELHEHDSTAALPDNDAQLAGRETDESLPYGSAEEIKDSRKSTTEIPVPSSVTIIGDAKRNAAQPSRRMPGIWQQCCTIVYHAWMLKFANKTSTILELFIPIFLIAILLIVTTVPTNTTRNFSPAVPTKLTTANYSIVYSYDPVPLSSNNGLLSYLTHGNFVPISQLLVAPKSDATMAAAKAVFQCMLVMAGYKQGGDPSAPPTSYSAPGLNPTVTTKRTVYSYGSGQSIKTVVHTVPTSYDVDTLTVGYNTAADAVNAMYPSSATTNSDGPDDYEQYLDQWINQAPVALIFDDAAVKTPSYSIHVPDTANIAGMGAPDFDLRNRLPRAIPENTHTSACDGNEFAPLDGGFIQQTCFVSYGSCIGSDALPCQVSYDQQAFQVAAELCKSDQYLYAGIAALQLCTDMELTRLHANQPSIPMPTVSTRMMPIRIVKISPHPTDLNPIIILIMLACGGFTLVCVVWVISLEKERKLKQLLQINGVTPTAYWLGWFLSYLTMWLLVGFILWAMLFGGSSAYGNINWFMLLIVMMMAGINSITMAFLIISLFSRALPALLCAVIYVFAIAVGFIIMEVYLGSSGCISRGKYWGVSLLGNYAFMLALNRMSYLSRVKGAVTWADFGSIPDSVGLSIGEAFMMQIIDTIIYVLLAYYFDQVIPNPHTTSRRPWFFLRPAFWLTLFTSNDQITTDDDESLDVTKAVVEELNANADVENVNISSFGHVGIVTQKLCKDYNANFILQGSSGNLAVDNISLAIYKNEITAILGHNGAGKTTTIKMLTGQATPTSGAAYILNHNIMTDEGLRAVQATLGLCAQDNILWPSLTVGQHLKIFGRLKNVNQHDFRVKRVHLLKQLDLIEKYDVKSCQLSGGQKRRLCLALALVGDPQIVFLDEPSCGVDPQSRRKIWDTLTEYKGKDRCVVLTSHSMYEADVLADRKLIVSKGKLRCSGTSVFLKHRFGGGYKLNVDLDRQKLNTADRQKSIQSLTQQITAVAPAATFPPTYNSNFEQLYVELPKDEIQKYKDVFALLENQEVIARTGIKDVGVAMVSLEEVFLNLSKETEPKSINTTTSNTSVEGNDIDQPPITYWSKFCALLRIRLILWRRRPIRYVLAMAIALALLFLAAYSETLLRNAGKSLNAALANRSAKYVDLQEFETTLYSQSPVVGPFVMQASNSDDYNVAAKSLQSSNVPYAQLPTGDTYSDLMTYGQQQSARFYAGAEIHTWPRAGSTSPAEYVVWYNGSFVHSLPLALNMVNSMLYKTLTGSASSITTKIYQESQDAAQPVAANSSSNSTTPGDQATSTGVALLAPLLYTMALSYLACFFVVDAVYDKQTGALRLLRLSNACGTLYWLPMLTAHIITYWLPMLLAYIIFCKIWTNEFIAKSSLSVFTFILHTFLFVLTMTILAYCVSMLFRKTTSALATILMVTLTLGGGASIAAAFTTIFAVHIVGMPTEESWIGKIPQVLSFLLPWWSYAGGLAAMIVSAIGSSSFGAPVDCWNNMYVLGFIGLLLWLTIAICLLILAETVSSGAARSLIARVLQRNTTDARMREHLELDNQADLFVPEANAVEDVDVSNERHLANKSVAILSSEEPSAGEDAETGHTIAPAITALHLQKQYNQSFVREMLNMFDYSEGLLTVQYSNTSGAAVINVSLQVHPNEILGLLGPNGAGKTTIMSMLVNETHPTAGLIFVDKYNALIQQRQATKLLGYCPQFDALWDEVTLAEHLALMASLHGQDANMRPPDGLIIRMAEKLGLTDHWNKKSKKLSGGTKRKLSFLLSIIDRNMTALLDEPSSGMDPSSARYLWEIIKRHFKNRPISSTDNTGVSVGGILTTHYMEEAEALCDRIAIMTKGNVRCIGTPNHLRNKFGSGYRLELRLVDGEDATRDAVTKNVMAQFSEAILKPNESRLNRLVFSVPQKQALPLSKSFAFLESQRRVAPSAAVTSEEESPKTDDTKKVVEYTITQASIEHVFLQIAGNQQTDAEAE